MDEVLTDNRIEALAYAGAIALTMLSSWWAGRRARQVLGRALGREIRPGEETSLRAWMAVPRETLATVDQELRNHAAEQVIGAMDRVGSRGRIEEHEPYSKPLSIR